MHEWALPDGETLCCEASPCGLISYLDLPTLASGAVLRRETRIVEIVPPMIRSGEATPDAFGMDATQLADLKRRMVVLWDLLPSRDKLGFAEKFAAPFLEQRRAA